MKIGELSKKTGVSVRSIRHYEKKNLISSKRLHNGYREFDESAIEEIRTIQLYLGLGLNTEQIEEIIKCKRNNLKNKEINGICSELLETYEKKLEEINSQIHKLTIVKNRLEEQINRFKKKQKGES